MTLKKLALHLNLSLTTVSRALNGHSEVNEKTRARVIKAARELGYSPNSTARRLALGKTDAIGVVLPLPAGHFSDPFFTEVLMGLGEVLHHANLDLILMAAPAGPDELKAYRRLVEGRRVEALVVGRTRRHDERIDYLLDRGFPFITYGRTETDRPYAWFDMDSEEGFFQAARRLIKFGHRHIALINAPEILNFALLRRNGYDRALNAAQIPMNHSLVVEGDLTEAGGYSMATRLLSLPTPPTAILCANDSTAMGALRAIKTHGLVVKRDISIIGFDDLPLASYTDPPLTTLHQPIYSAGSRIAEMLLSLLSGTPVEQLQELWQLKLVARQSDGPCLSSRVLA